MPVKPGTTTVQISKDFLARLNVIAGYDMRSGSKEIEWLIEQREKEVEIARVTYQLQTPKLGQVAKRKECDDKKGSGTSIQNNREDNYPN
jgi:hypothetical protein